MSEPSRAVTETWALFNALRKYGLPAADIYVDFFRNQHCVQVRGVQGAHVIRLDGPKPPPDSGEFAEFTERLNSGGYTEAQLAEWWRRSEVAGRLVELTLVLVAKGFVLESHGVTLKARGVQ